MTSALVRCYLPLSPEQLLVLQRTRRLEAPLHAFTAGDPSSGQGEASHHDEEEEHAALQSAARFVLDGGGPVIVAAADLDPTALQVLQHSGAGTLTRVGTEVTLPRVAALHVGDDVLNGAAAAVPDREIELSWYDTTEVDHLVGLL